ncbi:DUF3575 domain-containing protein [Hyphobacterium sp. CCMP332]|nr:DUF3575 domain-containing protein [Hyphobacterium sp. CCMP332]
MKRIILISVLPVLLLFLTTNNSKAQVKDNVVKLNLFGLIVGQYQMSYERALNENLSVQLAAGLISREWDLSFGTATNTQKDNGFIIIPEVRYYFSEAPKGVYGGAFIRYRSVTNSVEYTTLDQNLNTINAKAELSRNAIGGGLLIGYQVLISDAVAIDIQLGPQYKSVSTDFTPDANDPNTSISFEGEDSGVGVRFAVNFGIAF